MCTFGRRCAHSIKEVVCVGEDFDVIFDFKMYGSVFIKIDKTVFFLTCIMAVHVRKEGGRFVTVKEEMERLAQKYPEHADSLRRCVLVEDVLDAELQEFSKKEEKEEKIKWKQEH